MLPTQPIAQLARAFCLSLALAAPALGQTGEGRPPLQNMLLEAQFAGPFKDTLIQRLRDPQTGAYCYLYIPVRVENQPVPGGGVAYGANALGTISCLPAAPEAKAR